MKIELKNFEIPDIDSWKNQVLKESKNQHALNYINEIENLNVDLSKKNNRRTFHTPSNTVNRNDWDIVSYHKISNSFQKNNELIHALEHGSNHLYLDINDSDTPWSQIFENIMLDFIHVSIKFRNKDQIEGFKTFLSKETEHNFTVVIDPIDNNYVHSFKESKVSFMIDGFSCEQIGGSSYQQLGLILHSAEQILQEIKKPERIKFHVGIGSHFLIETSKVRALKWLWEHLLKENGIQTESIFILGSTGWTNKSLKDPNMNLLRQTTEGISGINGGISGLLIHPASLLSQKVNHWFDTRMSLNISHILKEESFLSKVNDPLHGSYIIEMITEQIIINSWDLFIEIQNDSHTETKKKILERIEIVRLQKEKHFLSGETQLLGINLFNIETTSSDSWQDIPEYLGMKFLIYENLL
jgi:methylmalonyl-CoA mutase